MGTESGLALFHKRFALALTLFLTSAIFVARAQEAVCEEIAAQALLGISENCAELERNSLCYAHAQVEASFADDAKAGHFTAPANRAPLSHLQQVRASAIDTEQRHWGLAIMNLQANLPQTRPGAGVIMLLAGDAGLDHELELAQIDEIREPLSAAALRSTTRFSQAAKIAAELGQLQRDEIALVDAKTRGGDWLRVVNDGTVSWVERDHLSPLQAMESLPIVDVAKPFAMQAFTFSSASGLADCEAAEPLLAIQTAADVPANLTVNGVDIHVQSLVSFQQVHRNALSMTVHLGAVTTAFGNTVLAGNSVVGILADIGNGKTVVLDWSGPTAVSEAELARGHRLLEALNGLARANGWTEQDGKVPAGDRIHVVTRGESLFALARRYDVRVADILAANDDLASSPLYVGTKLLIPNPGSGFGGSDAASSETPATPLATATESAVVDCQDLRLTSPLEAAPGGMSHYYWDGIAAASGYQIKVYDHGSGSLLGSFQTGAGQTSIRFSAGQLGVGGALQWEVIALAGSQPLCSTGKSAPLPHL